MKALTHGRLPWFAPEDLETDARSLYDRITGGSRSAGPQSFPLTDEHGRLNGPFNAFLVSPEVGVALQELGSAIRFRTALADRAREIAILELARLRRCAFEWYAHERIGLASGLSADEIAGLHDDRPLPTFSATEHLVRELVRTLVHQRDLSDAAFTAAVAGLGERGVMELIALVGYYDFLALSMAVWRTPLPAGTTPPFRDSLE